MFGSNSCFLTCIQISQEADKVAWYSHLFQNFPQFIVIYRVKGFGIVYQAEVDVFLELSCFFYDPTHVDNLISGSSAFSKSSLNIWNSWFMYCWSLSWRILSITLLVYEMSAIVWLFEYSWHCLSLGLERKLTSSCGHCWVFQICWYIEGSAFTASLVLLEDQGFYDQWVLLTKFY